MALQVRNNHKLAFSQQNAAAAANFWAEARAYLAQHCCDLAPGTAGYTAPGGTQAFKLSARQNLEARAGTFIEGVARADLAQHCCDLAPGTQTAGYTAPGGTQAFKLSARQNLEATAGTFIEGVAFGVF